MSEPLTDERLQELRAYATEVWPHHEARTAWQQALADAIAEIDRLRPLALEAELRRACMEWEVACVKASRDHDAWKAADAEHLAAWRRLLESGCATAVDRESSSAITLRYGPKGRDRE